MEENLQSANFEPIEVDDRGNFTFYSALAKLRRSIKGIHNKVFPVYVMNNNPNSILSSNTITTISATHTLYTVPIGKRAFVTGIYISYVADVACTNAGVVVKLTAKGLANKTTVPLRRIASVAEHDKIYVPFSPPIELEIGSTQLGDVAFGAGAMNCAMIIFGYETPL